MGKSKKQAIYEEAPLLLPTPYPKYPFRDDCKDFIEGVGEYLLTGEDYIALRETVGYPPNKSKLKVFLIRKCNIPDLTDYSFPDITETLRSYLEDTLNEQKQKTKPSQDDQENDLDTMLRPAEEKAYQSHADTIDKNPHLADAKDRKVYDWLKENGIDEYPLPTFETWARQVRAGRKHYGTSKNTPRAGRTSKSGIHITDPAVNQITNKF